MPAKKRSFILKVSNFLKKSIYIAKMSAKPIIPRLVSLNKSSRNRRLRKFKLAKANADLYNYQFLREYEFSPSGSPLLLYNRKELNCKSFGRIYSAFLLCRCLGGGLGAADHDSIDYSSLALAPVVEDDFAGIFLQPPESVRDGEDSVDQRAERFIARFYQEMRLQREDSF